MFSSHTNIKRYGQLIKSVYGFSAPEQEEPKPQTDHNHVAEWLSVYLKIFETILHTGLKGGALISALYAYSQHGDPDVRALVKHLLNQVQCIYQNNNLNTSLACYSIKS